MPIVKASFRQIPERLYHYTSMDAAYKIISGGKGKNEEICFWLKNALQKNDEAELSLGTSLIERLQKYMGDSERASLISDVRIDPKLVYFNSFTETDFISSYMLEEYGCSRLEFDFRSSLYRNDIHECSYFSDEDIPELMECYRSVFDKDWPLISGNTRDIAALADYLLEEMSAIRSIPLLKHVDRWSVENEWRHVLHQQENDSRVFPLKDGTLRMKIYYPASSLVGITYFLTKDNKSRDLSSYYRIKNWVNKKSWDTQVRIVEID